MANDSVKFRAIRVMQILMDETDEEHPMSANRISQRLEATNDITADRKTIYDDIQVLKDAGVDILRTPSKKGGFYVASRKFELPEVKLLVDAVQASKFITTKKSDELIKKLGTLTSKEEANQLKRHIFIHNRPKTGNETIYYNVDKIHTAMFENKTITFQYTVWNTKKELVPKKEGKLYEVSPHALTWDDENYYLVAYDAEAGKIKHYRVDKMKDTSLTRKDREGIEEFRNFNLAEYAKKTFGMYGGHDEDVVFICENSLVGVIIDRFGTDIMIHPVDADHFKTHALISVSRQFFGWVTAVGKGLHISGPENVKEEYKNYLLDIMGEY